MLYKNITNEFFLSEGQIINSPADYGLWTWTKFYSALDGIRRYSPPVGDVSPGTDMIVAIPVDAIDTKRDQISALCDAITREQRHYDYMTSDKYIAKYQAAIDELDAEVAWLDFMDCN